MHDTVGEVLAQRKALDRGAGAGVALSLLLHGGITAAAVFAALRHPPEQSVSVIEIKLAKTPAAAAPVETPAPPPVAKPVPKPQPVVEAPPQSIAKPAPPKTVPLSPYGQSPKKGAEQPSIPATR